MSQPIEWEFKELVEKDRKVIRNYLNKLSQISHYFDEPELTTRPEKLFRKSRAFLKKDITQMRMIVENYDEKWRTK